MKRVIYACLLTLLLLTCAQVVSAQLAGSCWPKFHKDTANTGLGLYGGTGSDLSWTFAAGGPIRSAPVVGPDGTSYFACDDGRLYAIGGDGAKRWDFYCNCLGSGSPTVAADGTTYLGSSDKYLYAIRSDGTLKWKRGLIARLDSSVSVAADGTIYFGCTDGTFYAYYSTGSQRWTYKAAGAITSSPAIGTDGTVYFGCQDGGLYALNSTGTLRWKFTAAGSGAFTASPAIGSDGTVYIGSAGGYFYAVRSNGTQRWRFSAGSVIKSSAAICPNGNIVFGSRDYKVHAVNSNGIEQWAYTTGHYVDSSPAIGVDGGIFVGSIDGNLYALNPDGTERWHYATGSAVSSSPAIGPAGCLFVGADNGTYYCFAADSTPPLQAVVSDDGAYTSILDRLHGTWSGVDPESGIFSYEYCIGTAPGLADVAGWLNVGSATQHTRTGLSLSDRQVYYITARAINGAGIAGPEGSSDGIVADATPPTQPAVTDGGRYTSSPSSLQASWVSADPESGIAGYQYSIGTSPGAANTLAWADAGTATSAAPSGLTLAGGTTYYFNVKALNVGGIWSTVGSSDGITVDVTAPSVPVVADAGQFISDAHSIFASWASTDNESGISKFEYSVGTSPGGSQVLPWTNAGTSLQATITGLSLTNGATYYVSVRATNGALLVSVAGTTDGAILDNTPPTTPAVTDDGVFTASTTTLHAAWTASDPESNVKSYKYAIGKTPGATDVVSWTSVGTDTSVTRSGLSLVDKQTYYISIIATNNALAESAVGTTNGITVDATAPTTPVVTDDGQYTASQSELHASWSSGDPESGLSRYEYSIGTTAGGADVLTWTDVALATSITKTGLHLTDGARYYISVRAYNTTGTVSLIGSSDGITVDTVSPPAPTVTDDGAFTQSGSSLHATWNAVTCPSGIGKYEYSVGTSAGGTTVRNWTSVGLETQVTATGLSLQSGVNYFINVRACNTLGKAGSSGSSNGIIVDLSAPPAPVVTDGGVWSSSTTQLTAHWTCADPESGVVEYKYAVGTTPHGTNALGWTSAGTNTLVTIGLLSMVDGGKYYISVKATNGAGATGPDGTTDGITIDATPPTLPVVTDDGAYTTDPSKLHATWASADPQSGIAKYEYSVGTSAGATDILAWTSASLATDYTITGLALASGTRYFVNVRATNAAGSESAIGSSDGIYAETTPPTTPVVTDDGQYTQSTTTIKASWASEDPETGVAAYQYSIGTSAGEADVVAWTDVALATSIERTDLTLLQGSTYYVNVRATNGIGLVSDTGSSDGLTVDTTPPAEPTVNDDGDYSSSPSSLHITLDCTDAESGIASYECAVGTTSGGTDIASWTVGGPGPEITIPDLTLTDGVVYYISARATNGVGIAGPVGISNGITVDATGPIGLTVTDDGQYTGFEDRLHAKWSASDPQSGIAKFSYCIGTAANLNDIADWLDVGTATEHTREGLSLVAGQSYYITVVATNRAGGASAPVSSDGIRLDLTPPSKPVVTDTGTYWGYRTSISGRWTAEDPESGIAEYEMSVGTSAGGTDVADWASVGNHETSVRTGLHLSDGITYYINIRAKNGAGKWGEVGSSDGVLIDSTPPTTPIVTDDGDTTSVLDRLHFIWQSQDPESGIAEYVYCIGTSPGSTDVKDWVSAGLVTEVTVTGLALDPVLRYYCSVKARSNSGAWSVVSASDGIGYSNGAAIWWRFRNDIANVGRGLFNATRVSDLAWTIPTDGYVESSPAISADGTTYIGSGDGKVYAITQNGTIRWSYDTGSPIDSSPAVAADGKIVLGCNDGKVWCLTPTGDPAWTYSTGDAVRSSPLINNGVAYVGSMDRSLHAINMETGTRIWAHSTGDGVRSSPAADAAGNIYFASGDAYVYAVRPDGTRKWRFWAGSATDSSPTVGPDGTVYIGSGNGFFYAINTDGTKKWEFNTEFVADSSAAIGPNGNIYFGVGVDGGSGRLYSLKPDGTKRWHVNLPGGAIISSPAIDPSGMIYVGACDNKFYAFNPDGSLCWSFLTQSSVISSPALGADSSVIFGSYDGKVYCVRDVTSKDLTPPTKPVVNVAATVISAGQAIKATWTASDPDSMVAEYTYAIGTAPGLSDVTGWISTGIETSVSCDDVNLSTDQTYYVSVKARNPSQRWSEVGVSEGVAVAAGTVVGSIGDLKTFEEGRQAVLVNKVVTAVFPDCFFVEEPSRCAGVRCMAANAELKAGDRVNVNGNVKVSGTERQLDAAAYSFLSVGDRLAPVGLSAGAAQSISPSPLGLYASIWGKVTAVSAGGFTLDTGYRKRGVAGAGLVAVQVAGGSVSVGNSVRVTGVLCNELVDSQPVPTLRVPSGGAVQVLHP